MKITKSNANLQNFIWLIVMVAVGGVALFCHLAGISLAIPLLVLYGGIYLYYDQKARLRLLLHLGLLLTLTLVMGYFLMQYSPTPSFYIPIASVGMLTMLLFSDLSLAFLMSLLASMVIGILAKNDLTLFLTFFIGSLSGVYAIKDARTRWDLIKTGVFVGIMQVACITLFHYDFLGRVDWSTTYLVHFLRPLFLNGLISVAVVMFTSKIFESIFGVVTNLSLLELADTNHPLLKRMAIEAPGTYHHSLIVSNLAESAANAIGAIGLLARVGAYYHDIGKLVKPEYFTENQLGDKSKHDELEPSISRLVILNHVKEGMELARKYKLNPIIIDFIPQHHGTGLLHYFYQRALEGSPEDVQEENFRYAGPKPQSRETAVVLLADSVEGAVRALDEPTPAKIDEVVRKIINNKFIDGQLDECDLTLKDIEKISQTFSRTLGAMYHSRIKYPEKKNGNDYRGRKLTEANPHKSAADHQGRKKAPSP